ncbi:MAG TPA: 16S rRNA (cytosine(1402)-N(4))-methyltransferase RsmH [Candidatus Paceibacterota bacterium]|nr:16S rRNA (cytosine(1402)-N(4))-methyltransferase RsmH [Candidatus Paceibacterota bacterium]
MEAKHDSVLFTETIDSLELEQGDVVVDATLGGAGHFKALFEALGPEGTLVGIDADHEAVARAQAVVDADTRTKKPTVHLIEGNFRDIERILDGIGISKADKILFDLGWSGFQLVRGRGFSFRADEPLLMTYGNPDENQTAADLVNSSSEEALVEILYTFGEERFARPIAKAIVRERKREKIQTTAQLVSIIEKATPGWYQHRRLHPATKTFQALRIAVNDELGAVRDGLSGALSLLNPNGRIAVITFHSIEDRIVKGMFRDAAYAGRGSLANRKPIVPSDEELSANPRARSAKLRVFIGGEAQSSGSALFTNHLAYV